MTYLHCKFFEVTNPWLSLPFQSAMRVTIAAVSDQVKTAQGVSGWQSGGRGWLAKTWKNKKTREVGHSTGNKRRLETKKDEHKAIMIVMTDHLCFPFCPCQTLVTIFAANTHFALIRSQVFPHRGVVSWCPANIQQDDV